MKDFSSVKAGDDIIINSRWNSDIKKVDRVTSTHIVIGCTRYRKSSGSEVGASRWSSNSLETATPERVQEIRDAKERAHLIYNIKEAPIKTLPLPLLREIAALIKKGEQQG